MLDAERIQIYPLAEEALEAMVTECGDPTLGAAYGEMLSGLRLHPTERLWYTDWQIIRKEDGAYVGDLCFKGGPDELGAVEIGYGLLPEYEHQGYMTEAVKALCGWALASPGVKRVEAETAPDNDRSKRVLARAGFLPLGICGEEGPRFFLKKHFVIGVSACLLGINCKYSGDNNYHERLVRLPNVTFIPVCPETMGGLATPRVPAEIVNGTVLTRFGKNVDREYHRGADFALEKVKEADCDLLILQSRSPSCGVKTRYDGTFSGRIIPGKGVFAALAEENGFNTLDIEDL